METKAILFDLDNTLLDRNEGAYQAYYHLVTEVKPELKADSYQLQAIVQDCMTWDQFGNYSKKFVGENLNRRYGFQLDIETMDKYWIENLPKHEKPFARAIETLEYLKKKYVLGLVTNGYTTSQKAKLANNDLNKYFSCVFISQEFGINKPDKRIFLAACNELGFLPEETVYVGDTYSNDIYGALKANIRPIWIWNDEDRHDEKLVTRIHKIEELMDIL